LAAQISYEEAYASTLVVQSEIPTWTGEDGTGSWSDYLNWTGGLPSTVNAPYPLLASTNPNLPKQTAANFLDTIQTPTTITLDGNQSITTMSFGSTYAYTVAPGTGGVITFTGTNPSITVTLGSPTISADVALSNNLSANLTGNLTLSGAFTTNGYTLTKTGAGTLTISGMQNHSIGSSIAVTSGVLNLNSDAGSPSNESLALSASAGTINFNAAQHLFSLSLAGGNATMLTDGQYLLTRSVSVTGSSTLDLRDNDMIVDYTGTSPIASIQSALATGYAHGNWSGKGIITSLAAIHPGTSLGFAEASDVLGLSGSATGMFDGQTVDATTVLVKYTWIGDTNLDGVVNAADLANMAPAGTTNATWSEGDFNYDGVVNADDYALFMLGAADQQGNISTITPEPSLLCLLLLPFSATPRRSRGITRKLNHRSINSSGK
jgi:autotransporter-associated beta strand protein